MCGNEQKVCVGRSIVVASQAVFNLGRFNMNQTINLANQHILEWESRLAHIDEMAARAHELHGKEPVGSDLQQKLAEISTYRQQLSLDLVGAQTHDASKSPAVNRSEGGIQASLEATGLQLERLLGSIVGADIPRRRTTDPTD
jgi:hypothetical protein